MGHLPRNIRQIGTISGDRHIYMEDYVSTYIRQLAAAATDRPPLAVLIGHVEKDSERNSTNLILTGAIALSDSSWSGEVWTKLYETIKRYFVDVEILGWMTTCEMQTEVAEGEYTDIQTTYFGGLEKTLLLYDRFEKEAVFYLSQEKGGLLRQNGYYIFYERNEEMQNYMIEHKQTGSVDPKGQDVAAGKIRSALAGQSAKKEQYQRASFFTRVAYGASFLMLGAVLVVSVSLYQQRKEWNRSTQTPTAAEQEATLPEEEEVLPAPVPELSQPEPEEETVQTTTETLPSVEEEVSEAGEPKEETVLPVEEDLTYYTVKKGDTLSGIAEKAGEGWGYIQEIITANELPDGNEIYPGEKLILP